jgi:hypothetical protein
MRRILLLLAAALAACNTGFEPQYRVTDLRILAVRSQAAGSPAPGSADVTFDVSFADTLALDALVVNPLGRPGLEVLWVACLPPASDALVPCVDQAYLSNPSKLLDAAAVPGSGVLLLPTGPSIQVPVPDVTAALQFAIYGASLEPTFECRLYAELVVVVVARAGGRQTIAQKRVRILPASVPPPVQNRYSLNLNPSVGDVRLQPADRTTCSGGVSISSDPFPSGKIVMCGLPGPGAIGQYNVCEPAKPPDRITTQVDEIMQWQWYVSAGEFPQVGGAGDARGGDVDFQRPNGAFTLWTIVRDGRGGEDWASYAVSAL